VKTSACVASAVRTNAARKARLWLATAPTPIHCSGEVSRLTPSSSSDSASAPGIGQKRGAFHHPLVNGTACAFHHRIHVVSAGS
jgi:hypothetical protein